ncbi:LacI family DNA-binding transcriptional regulator [Elioraea sp. Yellowstone]|uniref:LacI family DNA-binding transcriptional regulator n=1 Tax=Elioraea sp. Yellowstone TaxID=2592070 RepID=UPI00192A3E55|nr:LacI family DNA-binding transcriptional regulator [Elioraea sp. Yellowstone]
MDQDQADRARRARRWVTSADVARAAGVSRAAVSRAFTPGASVAPETRRRILAAAKAVGYRPNALARSLNTRRSGIVGVVITEIANPFYARLLEALGGALQARGLLPLVAVAPDPQATDDLLAHLLSYQVDGVVVASAMLSSGIAARCAAARTPVVLVDRRADAKGPQAALVGADNLGGGRLVADLLAAAGHSRPAFLAGIEATSTSDERERGFTQGLAAQGLVLAAREVGRFTYAGGLEAAQRLLARADRPDAVFCANDEMALGVIDAARTRFGLDIPRDLSVVGFDDTPSAGLAAYRLTTVAQDVAALAQAAVAALEDPAASPRRAAPQWRIPCRLVLRRSARLPEGTVPAD